MMRKFRQQFFVSGAAALFAAGCYGSLPPAAAAPAGAVPMQATQTRTAAPLIAARGPTPHPRAVFDKLHRDERGRIIGGTQFPLLNYSPAMITGKPCPRIKTWTFAVQQTTPPRARPSDPCVIQNAVDDLVRMLWFFPGANAPEDWPRVFAQYDDPFWVRAVPDATRLRLKWKASYPGQWRWNKCDKPVYRLIDASADTPIVAYDLKNEINGKVIKFLLMSATAEVGPYRCDFYTASGAPAGGGFTLTEADIAAGRANINEFTMSYDDASRQWVLGGYFPIVVPDYRERARRLMAVGRP
jgi:hypothetical protein